MYTILSVNSGCTNFCTHTGWPKNIINK